MCVAAQSSNNFHKFWLAFYNYIIIIIVCSYVHIKNSEPLLFTPRVPRSSLVPKDIHNTSRAALVLLYLVGLTVDVP